MIIHAPTYNCFFIRTHTPTLFPADSSSQGKWANVNCTAFPMVFHCMREISIIVPALTFTHLCVPVCARACVCVLVCMYLCFQSNRHRYNDDDVPKSVDGVCYRIIIIHICGSYESQTNHIPSEINISSYYSTFLRTSPMLARSSTVRLTRSALMPQMYFQLYLRVCVCVRWCVSEVQRVLVRMYVL